MSNQFPASFLNWLCTNEPILYIKVSGKMLTGRAMTNDEVDQYFIAKRKFDSIRGIL